MAIKIIFRTHKGGTGKTTFTFNAANYLTSQGYKVLCVDTDPQGSLTNVLANSWLKKINNNTSTWENLNSVKLEGTSTNDLFDGIEDFSQVKILKATHDIDLIYMIPNDFHAGFAMQDHNRCGKFIDSMKLIIENTDYDFVFFDLPPTVTPYVVASLSYVDYYVIPQTVAANIKAAKGEIDIISKLGKSDHLLGVVLNQIDRGSREHYNAEINLRDLLKDVLFNASIHHSTTIDTSLARNIPLSKVAGARKSYLEMREMIEEMLERIYIKQAIALSNGTFAGTEKEKQRLIAHIKKQGVK